MADTAKSTFEADLDSRVAAAQQALQQGHSDLFSAGDPDVTVETATTTSAPLNSPAPVTETPSEPSSDAMPTTTAEAPAELVTLPPKEETPAPAQAKPEDKDTGNWKAARELQRSQKREIEALKKQLEAMTVKPAAPVEQPKPTAEIDDEDPFGFKKEINTLRSEIEQRETQFSTERRAQQITFDLGQAEAQYRQSQPHGTQYDDAVKYMVDVERNRYELSGMATRQGMVLLNAANNFGDTDPRAGAVRKAIEAVADDRNISDEEAAAVVATDLWIATQRNGIIGDGTDINRVPDRVWSMAKAMGFQPRAIAAPATTPAAPAAPAQTTAEKIRAQVRASSAGKSLSNISSTGMPMADGPAIRTLGDFNAMFQKDPKVAREYMVNMMKINPNWHRELAAK